MKNFVNINKLVATNFLIVKNIIYNTDKMKKLSHQAYYKIKIHLTNF